MKSFNWIHSTHDVFVNDSETEDNNLQNQKNDDKHAVLRNQEERTIKKLALESLSGNSINK